MEDNQFEYMPDEYDENGQPIYHNKHRFPWPLLLLLGVALCVIAGVRYIRIRSPQVNASPTANSTSPVVVVSPSPQLEPTLLSPAQTDLPLGLSYLPVYTETVSRIDFSPASPQLPSQQALIQQLSIELGSGTDGISLYQMLLPLSRLNQIDAAAYDPSRNQLILIGRYLPGWPTIQVDDFVTALRGVFLGDDDFGMTIVPTGAQIAAQQVDLSAGDDLMDVFYFGGTENTHMGLVMFQADRYLKDLSIGLDENGQPFRPASIPDFRSGLEWVAYHGGGNTELWHREWFVPSEIMVSVSPDGQAMWIDAVKMEVQTRFVQFDANGEMYDVEGYDPAANDFVSFLTSHYDEFAEENQALRQLQQFVNLVTIARWMRDYQVPFDTSTLEMYPELPVQTPSQTMAHTASLEQSTYIYQLFGGVDLGTQPTYLQAGPDHEIAQLDQVLPSAGVGYLWPVTIANSWYDAGAISLQPIDSVGAVTINQSFLFGPTDRPLPLGVRLIYHSLFRGESAFGTGWKFGPAELTLETPLEASQDDPQYATIIVHDNLQQQSNTFEFAQTPDNQFEFFVAPSGEVEYPEVDGQTLRYNPAQQVYYWQNKDTTYGFDQFGRFVYESRNGESLTVAWHDNGLPSRISHSAGDTLEIEYTPGAIILRASTGETIEWFFSENELAIGTPGSVNVRYSYENGYIVQAVYSDGTIKNYTYDERGLLTEYNRSSPDASSQEIMIVSPGNGYAGSITMRAQTLVSPEQITGLGINLDRLADLGVTKLTLTDATEKVAIWESGSVRVPINLAAQGIETLADRLGSVQAACGGCERIVLSLEKEADVGYSAEQSRATVIVPDQPTWFLDLVNLSALDQSKLTEDIAASSADVPIIWGRRLNPFDPDNGYDMLVVEAGQVVRLGEREASLMWETQRLDGDNVQRQARISTWNTNPAVLDFLRQTDLNETTAVQKRWFFDGPPELARALARLYPGILSVSDARTPTEASRVVNSLPYVTSLPLTILVAEDQLPPRVVQTFREMQKDYPEIDIRFISGEAGRQTVLDELARENVLVLEVAHSPDNSSIQIDAITQLASSDIQTVSGAVVMLSCEMANGTLAERVIETGGQVIIAANRFISSEDAAQWIRAMLEVHTSSTASPDITILDLMDLTEQRLRSELGDDWNGYLTYPKAVDIKKPSEQNDV